MGSFFDIYKLKFANGTVNNKKIWQREYYFACIFICTQLTKNFLHHINMKIYQYINDTTKNSCSIFANYKLPIFPNTVSNILVQYHIWVSFRVINWEFGTLACDDVHAAALMRLIARHKNSIDPLSTRSSSFLLFTSFLE